MSLALRQNQRVLVTKVSRASGTAVFGILLGPSNGISARGVLHFAMHTCVILCRGASRRERPCKMRSGSLSMGGQGPNTSLLAVDLCRSVFYGVKWITKSSIEWHAWKAGCFYLGSHARKFQG